jgi:hypothetical protein
MKQLSEIQSNTMFVQPKLPTFQIVVNDGGASNSSSSSSSSGSNSGSSQTAQQQAYTNAYNSLDSATKQKIDQYLSSATVYSCYPCYKNGGTSDWQNFVKYAVIKGQTSTLEYCFLTWSNTVNGTGSTQTTTYTPTEANRKAALNLYNDYVNDAGATTGVKPICTTVDVNNVWSTPVQSANKA